MGSVTLAYAQIAFCLVYICSVHVQAEVDVEALKSTLASSLACHVNPGLSVAVVKDGKVVLAEGFGVADVDTNEPVTNRTLFGIASLSKAFASALLVKLLSKHDKYNLDTKVKDILGKDFGFSEEFRTEHTTLEDILSHRTGLATCNALRFDSNLTRQDLPRRIKYLPLAGKWRSSYIYNNLMYGLVTRIAEVIGGATWEELVQRELYDPLQMTSSAFATTLDFSSGNIAKPYETKNGKRTAINFEFSKRWALLCGSGCVMTTAEDAANWLRFHLSLGLSPTGERVVEEAAMRELYKARTPLTSPLSFFNKPDTPYTTALHVYAFGWKRGLYRGYQTIAHSGSTYGYRGYITMFPTEKLGIFTALNDGDYDYRYRMPLHNYIADTMLGETPWLNTSTICSFPRPWFNVSAHVSRVYKQSNILSRDASEYVGVFHNQGYGNMVISYNETEQQLYANYGFGNWRLSEQDGGEFYGEGIGINIIHKVKRMQFKRRSNSKRFDEVVVITFERRSPPVFVREIPKTSAVKDADSKTSASRSLEYPLLLLAYVAVAYSMPRNY